MPSRFSRGKITIFFNHLRLSAFYSQTTYQVIIITHLITYTYGYIITPFGTNVYLSLSLPVAIFAVAVDVSGIPASNLIKRVFINDLAVFHCQRN